MKDIKKGLEQRMTTAYSVCKTHFLQADKKEKELWKNREKRVDKWKRQCYYKIRREKVVEMRLKNLKRKLKRCWQTTKHMILYQSCVERYNTEPWQINSNATLKILNKELFREQNLNKVNERLNLARVNFDQRSKLKHESLILAQDERWRRA